MNSKAPKRVFMSQQKVPADTFRDEVSFMIRLLNEATETNLSVRRSEVFRPIMTIHHPFEKTIENAANFLVKEIRRNEDEFMNKITWKSILALVSTKHEMRTKAPAVNLAIKWLLFNPTDSSTLNTILMSIHLPSLPMRRVVQVRLGIQMYLTTPELKDFFLIGLGFNGYIYIKIRPELLWKEYPKTLIETCRSINKITDNYHNPSWPNITKRYDPEVPRWKKGKYVQPDPVESYTDLKNPLFKWNFNPNDFASPTAKPIEPPSPLINSVFPKPKPRIVLPEKIKSEVAVAIWIKNIPAPEKELTSDLQAVQKMLMKPVVHQNHEEHRKASTVTKSASSGYQSMQSSRRCTQIRKNSQKTSMANIKVPTKTQSGQEFRSTKPQNQPLNRSPNCNNPRGNNYRYENNHQLKCKSNEIIPVKHRRLIVPRMNEDMKKENHYKNNSNPVPHNQSLRNAQKCDSKNTANKQAHTFGSSDYHNLSMSNTNARKNNQRQKKKIEVATDASLDNFRRKFYFDTNNNVLEMNLF